MRRVPLDRLLRGHPGCVHSADDQMAWYPAAGVVGFSVARRLGAGSVHALAALVELLGRHPAAEVFVLDAGRLEPDGCDASALQALVARVLEPLAALAGVGELRVVAAGGLAQAAVVGAVALAWPRAWRTVPSLGVAFHAGEQGPPAWVEPLLSTLANELAPLGVVSRVRATLGVSPGASLQEVAATLGLGPRSLQRALEEAATTFAIERTAIRLELAAARLAGSDKLQAIAAEVGYRSLPHFTRVFRAHYGVSPGAFRARRRHWQARVRELT